MKLAILNTTVVSIQMISPVKGKQLAGIGISSDSLVSIQMISPVKGKINWTLLTRSEYDTLVSIQMISPVKGKLPYLIQHNNS
jgi:hypothetical protein